MRFTFITTLYPGYIAAFYQARPGLDAKPYSEQKAALDQDGFAWNGAFEPAFGPLGYEVQSIYANVEPLQRAWAGENGVAWPGLRWIPEIAWQQLRAFRPEVLWLDSLAVFRRAWIERARAECPSLRRVFGYSGVDVHDPAALRACDAVLTSIRFFVETFQRGGAKSYLFRHAFNPAILDRLPSPRPVARELLFAGSIARGDGDHLERERLIEALVDAVPMSIHCPQGSISYAHDWIQTNLRRGLYLFLRTLRATGMKDATMQRLPVIGRAADWRQLPLSQINPRLYPRMKPPFYGLAMVAAMRDHAVALNRHIDLARSEAGNIRLFEATGAGTCLLTDWKENMGEMFELDREVAVYRTAAECVEKARWLLDHPAECSAMAQAGQARTLRSHTFAQRALELDHLLRTEFR